MQRADLFTPVLEREDWRRRRPLSWSCDISAGVVGVALSGRLLQHAGGAAALAGWRHAFGLAALLCVGGSTMFLRHARGDRLFGETDQFT